LRGCAAVRRTWRALTHPVLLRPTRARASRARNGRRLEYDGDEWMDDNNIRNTAIVELHTRTTKTIAQLQGLSKYELNSVANEVSRS
jgi:hypothetical protein